MGRIAYRLNELEREVERAAADGDAGRAAAGWRAVLDLYHEESTYRDDPEPDGRDAEYERLWDAARRAMAVLGGQAEPTLETLADYDHRRFGPLLGVSDEGSATAAIRHGALASPKCAALGRRVPLTVGVAHDAERLGAVGEVAVGPDEYAAIRLACRGRLLTTTNVGTRVNLRHFLAPPEVRVRPGPTEPAVAAAVEHLKERFAPFVRTPSGRPRPLTVLVRFAPKAPARQRRDVLRRLQEAVAAGDFCKPKFHRLGLLVELTRTGAGRLTEARSGIDLAADCGVAEVALDGSGRAAVARAGLLNTFEPDELAEVLGYAAGRKVRVGPPLRVDPQTTARHVWTGLSVARNMGFELGKYGLVPLTFEEQKEVIARVQYWFPHWCAAPVYYLDHPLVTATDVYHGDRLDKGIRRWLDMVAKLKVRVVLIDTAEKAEGRRLLKDAWDDARGFLTAGQVIALTAHAERIGVKVLWAGGITLPQAYEFGLMRVFGVYVTSAAAGPGPVGTKYRRDPYLAGSREPQAEAVARVKLLLEAGFHVMRLAEAGAVVRMHHLNEAARAALAAGGEPATALHARLVDEWREHLAIGPS
jgi:hypothetical protein